MTENIGSESFSIKTTAEADLQVGRNWLDDAANSAIEHFKNNPVETVCGALLVAGAGAAALRFRNPELQDLTQVGLQRTGLLAKDESMAAAAMDLAPGGQSFVQKLLPFSESATIKSPYVLRKSGFVPESGNAAELSTLKPPKVSFENLDNLNVPQGNISIPTFTLEGGLGGAPKLPISQMRFEASDSPIARLYMGTKDATVQITQGRGRHGTGFFIDEAGLIATAKHVVPDTALPLHVRLASGELLPARLIAREERSDLALLKVDKLFDRPAPLSLVDSPLEIEKGRRAFLFGHPSHVKENVMTEGRILKYEETRNPSWTFARVRHDAPFYPGISGGPLVLDNGLVASVLTSGNLTKGTGTGTSVVHLRQMLDSVSQRGYRGAIDVLTDAKKSEAFSLYG